jgi:hypothetical protein
MCAGSAEHARSSVKLANYMDCIYAGDWMGYAVYMGNADDSRHYSKHEPEHKANP